MIERGNCHFVIKAQNVEKFGGVMTLVVDNKSDETADHIVMSDDGQGASVSIPTFLVAKSDGAKLKDTINKPPSDDKALAWKNMVILQADINMMSKTDQPIRVDLWYSSAAELLHSGIDFEAYAKMQDIFGDQVIFQPRTMTHNCPGCSQEDKDRLCASGGKLCPILPISVL